MAKPNFRLIEWLTARFTHDERARIQKKIVKKISQINKLQEEIYWLARERDELKKD